MSPHHIADLMFFQAISLVTLVAVGFSVLCLIGLAQRKAWGAIAFWSTVLLINVLAGGSVILRAAT